MQHGGAQVRETRQSLKQVESGDWVRENHLVRHNVREAPWSLEDGTKVRLPVVNGQQAEGDFLQLVGGDLAADKLAALSLRPPLSSQDPN